MTSSLFSSPRRTFLWAAIAALVGIVLATGDASACLRRRCQTRATTVYVIYVPAPVVVRPPAERIPPPKIDKGEKIPPPKDGDPAKPPPAAR